MHYAVGVVYTIICACTVYFYSEYNQQLSNKLYVHQQHNTKDNYVYIVAIASYCLENHHSVSTLLLDCLVVD